MKSIRTLIGILTITMALLVSTMAQAQNGSVYFDGSTGDGSFATTFFNGTTVTQFTLECWVNVANPCIIWSKNGFWKDASLYVETDSVVGFEWDDPTTETYWGVASNPGVFSTNQWHEVSLVFDGPSVTLYLDAVAVAQTSQGDGALDWQIDSGGASRAGNHLCAGWNGVAQSLVGFLQGFVAEFRVWNRPLSQHEVQSKMDQILNPASESGLVGYWLLNAGSGTTVADLAGTNNITLEGGTVWSTNCPPRSQGTQFSALNLLPITLVAAACDSSNNTYVLGAFTNTVSIGGTALTSLGGTDYLLAQYHPDGTFGWAISFGTPQNEDYYATTLAVMSNGVFVSGTTPGSIHIVDTASNVVNTAYVGGGDGFLLCFSLTGVAQWQASVTGISAGDNGHGVALDAAGNVYWVGCFNGCCPSQGGATLTGGDGTSVALSTPSYSTGFLTKLSSAGKPLWVATAYNRDIQFNNVAVDSQGNPYVLGEGTSWSSATPTTVVNADGTSGVVSNQGTQSEFLIKFNTLGIMQWSASLVGTLDYTYYPISMTCGDNVLFGGGYSSGPLTLPSTDGNNLQLAAPLGYDGFVAQYDTNGKANWAVQIPGTNDQHVVAICCVSSNVWVGGLTTGGISLPGISLMPTGTQNIFILQTDTKGNVLNGSLLGGTATDALTSLQVVGSSLGLVAGNEGGDFQAWGIEITNAGPFVLTSYPPPLPPPPSITSQPQSVTVNAYASAAFSVTAAGTTPLSYQWSFNGTNISGATSSSLSITNVTEANLGAYAVVVSNPFGIVTSSNAVLSMYPFLINPFGGLDTDWGFTNTLSVGAWGTGPLSYQWFDNDVAIANATNQTLSFTGIQFTNAGLYSVVVSSPLGSVTNKQEQVIVNPAGVSLGMYPGVTVSGVVGYTYTIQATADLANTNSWTNMATMTLMQPIQLWVDINCNASSPTNAHRFYRVLPGE